MKKLSLLLLLFLAVSFTSISQDYDYGKVSIEDFSKPIYIDDEAVILYENRRTNFEYDSDDGWIVITKIHKRIKINTKDGLDWGTHSSLLWKTDGNVEEEMSSIKGVTYNLVGGKIEKTKLRNDGIFKEDVNDYRNKVSLTFPEIKEGSILEFQYTITSPFWNIKDIEMQYSIPVNKIEARIDIPEYFIYNQLQKGYHPSQLNRTSESRKIIVRWREPEIPGGAKTEVITKNLEFIENRYTISESNIPGLKSEEYVNDISNYRASYVFELAQYRPSNGQLTNYALSWENVVETIYKRSSFGGELNKTGYFENDIDALISSVSDPLEKTTKIYNYVKSKVKWNSYYGKYTSDGVRKAYKDQVGNVAEINLMLTSMLRFAGIKANPVLISTRKNGIPLFPTLDGYNYVVSGIEGSNGIILLDATSKFSSPNILPFRALNWEGRLVKDDGSSTLINLYPNEVSKNTVSIIAKLNANGNVEGSQRSVKTNHDAMLYREKYTNVNKENFLEDLENSINDIEILDFEVKNELDLSKPVMETFSFNLENQLDEIGEELHITPLLFLINKENPFKLETREFPVDFGFPSMSKYRINISFPENYEVSFVPESVAYTLPENIGNYKYVISNTSNGIQLLVDLEINQSIISAEYYSTLKDFFKEIISKEAEQIILKKI